MKPKQEGVERVVILAAGQGMRLRPLTEALPKAMVSCAGWTLLAYALEFARHLVDSDEKITVVAGYQADLVEAFLEAEAPGAKVAINHQYEKGNLLSVVAARAYLKGDFVLMNVDHIYPFAFANRFLERAHGITAAVDFDRSLGPDDMKVKLDGARGIEGISKGLKSWDCGYIGMTLVRKDALPSYLEALDETLMRLGERAVAEDVLQTLSDKGVPIHVCDLSGLGWLEIDTLEDLEAAEARLMEDEDFLHRTW